MLRQASLWLPVMAFMAAIVALAVPDTTGIELPVWDKLVHAAAYGFFCLLNLRAFHGGVARLRPWPTGLALLLTVAFGAFDEWNQTRIPGRDPSAGDWIADVSGAVAALPVGEALARWRERG